MKRFFITIIIILISFPVFSQLKFEDLSFDQALEKSKQTGKLIFLQFESEGCSQCNEVANKAFENKGLSEQLEQTFICIKIELNNPDRKRIATLYNKKQDNFGSMFISSDANLIHSYSGSTTHIPTYQDHIAKALDKAGESLRISQIEKEYNAGNKSPGLMELLIKTRRTLNLETDNLLDEYVNLLPADSFSSTRTIQFIASMAPILMSVADQKMRQNPAIFDESWKLISLPKRVDINAYREHKSMQKAILEKNESYAYFIASFTKSTYASNLRNGQQAFEQKLLEYYHGTNDTTEYLKRAFIYFDKYFMNAVVDTIKKSAAMAAKKRF